MPSEKFKLQRSQAIHCCVSLKLPYILEPRKRINTGNGNLFFFLVWEMYPSGKKKKNTYTSILRWLGSHSFFKDSYRCIETQSKLW